MVKSSIYTVPSIHTSKIGGYKMSLENVHKDIFFLLSLDSCRNLQKNSLLVCRIGNLVAGKYAKTPHMWIIPIYPLKECECLI